MCHSAQIPSNGFVWIVLRLGYPSERPGKLPQSYFDRKSDSRDEYALKFDLRALNQVLVRADSPGATTIDWIGPYEYHSKTIRECFYSRKKQFTTDIKGKETYTQEYSLIADKSEDFLNTGRMITKNPLIWTLSF